MGYSPAVGPLVSYFLQTFPVKKKKSWRFYISSKRHSLAGRPCFILPIEQMQRVFQAVVGQADFKPQFAGRRTLCASSLIFGMWGVRDKTVAASYNIQHT
ncbi:UNVERIFIED_CONTAM: hypothetical protein K2H54_037457 [Gekko kuhli]